MSGARATPINPELPKELVMITAPPAQEARRATAQPRHPMAGPTSVEEAAMTTLVSLLDVGAHVQAAPGPVPCQEYDAEMWFAESPADVENAKALCGLCPARRTCLAGALARAEPWGVWGGQLLVQGEIVARKRPRGRPRKDAAAA